MPAGAGIPDGVVRVVQRSALGVTLGGIVAVHVAAPNCGDGSREAIGEFGVPVGDEDFGVGRSSNREPVAVLVISQELCSILEMWFLRPPE